MNINQEKNNISIDTSAYTLKFDPAKPMVVDLVFQNGIGAELFVASGCDRDEMVDTLVDLKAPEVKESGKTAFLTFEGKTTLWDKVLYTFECREDKVLYSYKVHGTGKLDNIRFFEGFLDDNPATKDKFYPYFPGWGRHVAFHRPWKYFASSSTPKFDLVHSFTVNASDTRYFNYYEDTKIRVGGDRFYLGGDWLVTPPPFLYLMGRKAKDAWVSMGVVAKSGENTFFDYEYFGGEGFGLNMNYQGYTEVDGEWESPQILIEATDSTVYDALNKYVGYLRDNEHVKKNEYRDKGPRWWYEPIFGGWGEQMVYSTHWPSYFEGSSKGWSGSSDSFCTRPYYERMLGIFEEKKIDPTLLIVDNRWFQLDHHFEVEKPAWPNMKEFVQQQHEKGRRIILWVSPWHFNSSSGYSFGKEVPLDEQMILEKDETYELEIDTDIFYTSLEMDKDGIARPVSLPKKKKRVPAEFNLEERHWEVLADPYNPKYEERIRENVRYLLSEDGLNVDGFEFDYTHFLPIYRNIRPIHENKDRKWGVEMLHKMIWIFYDEAKKIKPEALIIDHIFNPYFDDVTDMLRMQDIYTDAASIVPQMEHRGKIARAVCPDCAIHTDQHPMPSLEAWREYAKFQPAFGNPCTYYVTAIETTREKFTDDDYKMLREVWEEYDRKLTEKFGPKQIGQ